MAGKIKKRKLYVCKVCGSKYLTKELADKCAKWCGKNPGTCDPRITKHAIIDNQKQ